LSNIYLSLSEAARILNVHPTTIRRWTDDGKVNSTRTPGGHRRFLKRDIEALASGIPDSERNATSIGERIRDRTLTHTRAELSRTDTPSWVSGMDQQAREEKKLLGRRLMGLLMQYLGSDDENIDQIMNEAVVVGRIYAVSIRQSGVSLPEATKALMFFRDQILESAVMLPESVQQRPEANRKTFRRITDFLNSIQLVMVEAYDVSSGN
jgi:excisionase family DNA binding protein